MRAPPESLMPMRGMPSFMAWSMILVILRAWASPREPPATVKSWAKMHTGWPPILPVPVTTPSPGRCFLSMPKSWHLCSTKRSYSWKVPGSRMALMRSRAGSLPMATCFSMALGPPPALAWSRLRKCSKIRFSRDIPFPPGRVVVWSLWPRGS